MAKRLLATALLMLLLAGCSSPGAKTDDVGDAGDDPMLPHDMGNMTMPMAAAPVPLTVVCDVERTQLGTPAGVGLFLDRAVLEDPGCYLDDLFGAAVKDAKSLLVEIDWTAQASVIGANAWLEADDCPNSPIDPCPLPTQRAEQPPLRLTLEGRDFTGHAGANLGLQVAADGVAVQQPFTVHLTLFGNDTVPAGYTALS